MSGDFHEGPMVNRLVGVIGGRDTPFMLELIGAGGGSVGSGGGSLASLFISASSPSPSPSHWRSCGRHSRRDFSARVVMRGARSPGTQWNAYQSIVCISLGAKVACNGVVRVPLRTTPFVLSSQPDSLIGAYSLAPGRSDICRFQARDGRPKISAERLHGARIVAPLRFAPFTPSLVQAPRSD